MASTARSEQSDTPGSTDAADPSGIPQRWRHLAIGAVVFLVAIILQLVRQTGIRSWNTIWAEDGRVYIQQAGDDGLGTLFRGYNGYLQLPSRVIALGSALVPGRGISLFVAVAGAIVGALLGLFIYRVSREWVATWWVRLALAAVIVLGPILVQENSTNAVNLIWSFYAVAVWALISKAETRTDVGARCLVAAVAAMSTPLTIVFVPIAIGWPLLRKTRAAWIVSASFLAGLAVQALTVKRSSSSFPEAVNPLDRLPATIGNRVFAVFLFGDRGAGSVWDVVGSKMPYLAAALVLAAMGLLAWKSRNPARALAAVLLACALATFVLPVWGRGFAPLVANTAWNTFAWRYSVAPVFLLASAIAVLVDPPGIEREAMMLRIGRIAFVAQTVIVISASLFTTNERSTGPNFPDTADAAYIAQCEGRDPDTIAEIQVSPVIAVTPWTVGLPCRRLAP